MAKVYDALKRIEKERQQQRRALPTARAEVIGRPFWTRWFARRAQQLPVPTLDGRASELDRLAARLDRLEDDISRNIPTASDVMLLDRVEALADRLDAFEERMVQTIRSGELIAPLEASLAKLESELMTRLSKAADQLHEPMGRLRMRVTALCLVLALLLVAILLRR